MTMSDPKAAEQPSSPPRNTRNRPAGEPGPRPWRTEGLPKEKSGKRRWLTPLVWAVGYLILFGLMTVQDRMASPETVPYTEFKTQVANANVAEVFARGNTIEGALKKEAPLPSRAGRTYQQFKT